MFSLICVWINGWVNKREAGDLKRHRGHYDVTVMTNVASSASIQFELYTTKCRCNPVRLIYNQSIILIPVLISTCHKMHSGYSMPLRHSMVGNFNYQLPERNQPDTKWNRLTWNTLDLYTAPYSYTSHMLLCSAHFLRTTFHGIVLKQIFLFFIPLADEGSGNFPTSNVSAVRNV